MIAYKPARQFARSHRIEERQERRGAFASQRVASTERLPDFEPDFEEAADLYYRRAPRGLGYRHFDSAGAAVRFAGDNLSAHQIMGSVLQVGERRFEGAEVAAMVQRLPTGATKATLDG